MNGLAELRALSAAEYAERMAYAELDVMIEDVIHFAQTRVGLKDGRDREYVIGVVEGAEARDGGARG